MTPSRPIKVARVSANSVVSSTLAVPLLPSRYFTKTRLDPIEHGSTKPIRPSPAGIATRLVTLVSLPCATRSLRRRPLRSPSRDRHRAPFPDRAGRGPGALPTRPPPTHEPEDRPVGTEGGR